MTKIITNIMSNTAKTDSNQDTIKLYFSKIANHKLLTKEEQIELGFQIENNNTQILRCCIKSEVFIQHLNILINKMLLSEDKLSKSSRLYSESTSKKGLNDLHQKLIECLDDASLIDQIGLTSSAITNLLNPIKILATKISDIARLKIKAYSFLEIETDEEYKIIVKKCKDPIERRKLAKRLYTTEQRLIDYLQLERTQHELYKKEKIKNKNVQSLIMVYNDVVKLEKNAASARDALITSNLKLVVNRAKRFKHAGVPLEELIQEGNVGLIRAVDKFEPSKNIKVSTYATWWIDQAIQRGIANKKDLVRIPVHIQDQIQKINTAFFVLSQTLKRPPSLLEISKSLEISIERVEELQQCALHEVGLEQKLGGSSDGNSISYLDVLIDKNSETAASKTDRVLLNDKVRRVLSTLEPRLQKILMARFGIGWSGGQDHKLIEIANQVGLSKQRIRMIVSEVTSKLKKNGLLQGLE